MARFQVRFDSDRCKGCELCGSVCPKGLIVMSGSINNKGYSPATTERSDECVGCQSCALVCPDGAIEIYKED
ncbi:MAG: 4Fe-4S dicluster domain-containing protein [Oscillospiraceae bacterium]|jgi:2-oxoglutarate ferredoxin oxidoreductase subunit delta|nr:4Fe-4S dicluster domain-containing protein [Oscillospiraceae bacterium]